MVTDTPPPAGAHLARQMLNIARAEARKRGTGPTKRPKTRRRVTLTGGRDPQSVGSVLDQLADSFGWTRPSAGAQVIIRWGELAPDLVRYASPERYDAETRTLHLRPVSPAAATHLRMNAPRIVADLNERSRNSTTISALRILSPGRPSVQTNAASEDPAPRREPPEPRTRAEASAGLIAAQQVIAAHRDRDHADPTQETRDRYFGDIRGTLREPEQAFTDAVVLQGDLGTAAQDAEDVRRRALAVARAQKAGRAPAVPRAFDQTA